MCEETLNSLLAAMAREDPEMPRHYTNDDVTVIWRPGLCQTTPAESLEMGPSTTWAVYTTPPAALRPRWSVGAR